ncbi:MAG TPA: cytochrome c oxidase assembly protein [Gaiellaceae bacterium]|nr:cytochrome c oxidase assembly protein [Gaiellaceae bacterium]
MHPYVWEPSWDEGLATVLLAAGYLLALRFFPASRARKRCFAAAIVLLLLAFQTPLERISLHYLLAGHLLQNVVLAEWTPLLAVLAVPPAMAAAIVRHRVPRILTHPLVALPLWLVTYYVWHAPPVYDFALRHSGSLLHVEHLSYFLTGAAMWWPVVQDAPREWSSGIRAGYVFAGFMLASPIGLLMALVGHAVYTFYASAPERLWGLSMLQDQQIAGLTMAAEQAVVFFSLFAFYFFRFFEEEGAVPRRVT